GEVDAAVRRELRGVDGDACAVRVREVRQLGDRQQLAGDVAGAGDGEEGDGPLRQGVGDPRHRARQRVRGLDAPVGAALPGQEVRVVLHVEEEDLTVVRNGGGEQVQRVGGVP